MFIELQTLCEGGLCTFIMFQMMQALCRLYQPTALSCAAAPFTKQAHIPDQGNLPNQLLFYRPVSALVVRAKKNTVMQQECEDFFFPLISSPPALFETRAIKMLSVLDQLLFIF